MSLFPDINQIYSTYFGISPPSRACVEVPLPSHIRLVLNAVCWDMDVQAHRHALHVQSVSYWAPANIGPYSQAVMVCHVIWLPTHSHF